MIDIKEIPLATSHIICSAECALFLAAMRLNAHYENKFTKTFRPTNIFAYIH